MCMLNLIPPLVADGGVFDTLYLSENDCGIIELKHGLHFENTYYSILHITMSFIGISLPFLFPDLPKPLKIMSFMMGAWFLAGLTYGLIKMSVSKEIIDNATPSVVYLKIMIGVTVVSVFTFLESLWMPEKKS